MVTIKPFKGVRYAPEKIPDLSVVVSQPHDRIRSELQEKYYNLSPYNIVRIIKGKEQPEDGKADNVYMRARDTYHAWLREGIFTREQAPALYVTQQTFTLPDGRVKTRQGVSVACWRQPQSPIINPSSKQIIWENGITVPHRDQV